MKLQSDGSEPRREGLGWNVHNGGFSRAWAVQGSCQDAAQGDWVDVGLGTEEAESGSVHNAVS